MNATAYRKDLAGLDPSMKGPIIVSTLFHLSIFIISAVGLPYIMHDTMKISPPINVEIVTIDEITQTNRAAPPVQKEKKEPPPKPEKPTPPQMDAEKPPDLLQPKAPELKEEKPPEKPAEKLPTPEAMKKPPESKPKPEPKKPETTKAAEPTQQKNFQSLLKNLTPEKEQAPSEETTENSDSAPDTQVAQLSDRLTISEEDALRRQLGMCWNVMAGAKDAENIVVEIRVTVNRDRTVQDATILDQGRYNRDTHFRAAGDAALRALRNPRCSPLALPPDKYNQWRTTVIRFDPQEML